MKSMELPYLSSVLNTLRLIRNLVLSRLTTFSPPRPRDAFGLCPGLLPVSLENYSFARRSAGRRDLVWGTPRQMDSAHVGLMGWENRTGIFDPAETRAPEQKDNRWGNIDLKTENHRPRDLRSTQNPPGVRLVCRTSDLFPLLVPTVF